MNIKIKKILTIFKEKINDFYKNKLVNIILFGSQARNDAENNSDIDILIILKDKEINPVKEIREISDLLTSLSLEFSEVISCVFVSEERYLKENSPLLLNIRKEGIIL